MGKFKAKMKSPKATFKTKSLSFKNKKKSINKKFITKKNIDPFLNRKKETTKPKVNYSSMTVDDFMNNVDDSGDSSNEQSVPKDDIKNINLDSHPNNKSLIKVKSKKLTKKASKLEKLVNEEEEEVVADTNLWGDAEEELADESSGNYDNEISAHKASLEKLRKTDPEFYKFLQDNDKKLLDFNISDSEPDDDDEQQKIHKPMGDLEIASDESDFEADGNDKPIKRAQEGVVTLRMLKSWQEALQADKSNKTIACVVDVFHAALLRVSNEENETSSFKVDGSSVFNGVIQLCVLELSPAIRRFLGLTHGNKVLPHKCKKFIKIKKILQRYFTDLLKLLSGVTSTNILTVLLKHLHHMSLLLVSFPSISKPLVKKLIHLWGTGEEVIRVLAFFCILRITNSQLGNLLDTVLKSMYITYVINSKFVSVGTLSCINFMKRSLVEMFALDPGVSYQYVFLYIRQLAIHLRNATTIHRKENIQAVYNWQFVNSLKLWNNLLRVTIDKPQLQSLVYPFVQVCLGTIKLVATTQYFPLRFHIVQMLIEFSRDTGVFIPVLPFILDVLNNYDFNKKHKKASVKPMNLTCLLRMSNSQMSEHGFKDCLIDNIYSMLLEYLASQSHSIAFPDLSLICIVQLKQFISKCKIANYSKKLKQIVDKINQNNEFIENERKHVTFNLKDLDKIDAWERIVKNKGTPLSTFYESWNKLRTIKKNKEATNSDKIGDYNLPVIKKIKKSPTDSKPLNPFPSDSDSDGKVDFHDDEEDDQPKKKNKKRKKKKLVKKNSPIENENDGIADDQEDVVEDLKISDW